VPGSGVNRDNHPAPIECPACSGTGRVPGLARELFAAHPLTRVVLTDREPTYGQSGWYWMTGNNRPDETPYRITKHFQKRHKGYTRFATRDDALTALSDACCAYGRGLAGLRPLTAPTS
jgi:hypothetical protein